MRERLRAGGRLGEQTAITCEGLDSLALGWRSREKGARAPRTGTDDELGQVLTSLELESCGSSRMRRTNRSPGSSS